jgi:hypothetical protein
MLIVTIGIHTVEHILFQVVYIITTVIYSVKHFLLNLRKTFKEENT